MNHKLFSVAEADALLPRLRPLVERLRGAAQELREAGARVGELVARHGEAGVDKPTNPDRDAYWALVARARDAEERLQALLDEVRFLGAEVKDLEMGLLDFPTRRDGETVLLCWRLEEERVGFWHDLRSGFAGRRPLEELEQPTR